MSSDRGRVSPGSQIQRNNCCFFSCAVFVEFGTDRFISTCEEKPDFSLVQTGFAVWKLIGTRVGASFSLGNTRRPSIQRLAEAAAGAAGQNSHSSLSSQPPNLFTSV